MDGIRLPGGSGIKADDLGHGVVGFQAAELDSVPGAIGFGVAVTWDAHESRSRRPFGENRIEVVRECAVV